MKERNETIQTGLLIVCAAVLITLGGLTAAGFALPGAELFALVATLLVLGGLYLVSYRSTRHEIIGLRDDIDGLQQRETFNAQVVEALARAIDARDQGGRGRAERVRDLTAMIAEEMGIEGKELETLRIAALLADIGKLAVPDYVLSKPGALTDEELRKVRTHPIVGASILAGIRFAGDVASVVRGHHEWFDGSGYPDGLSGEEIPLSARILAVTDVYNALISERPHRSALSFKEAAEIIEKGAGRQFDPAVVEVALRVLSRKKAQERFGFIYDSAEGSHELRGGALSEHQKAAFAGIAQAQRELLALFDIVQTTAVRLNTQETLDLLMSKTRKILNFTTGIIFFAERATSNLRAATVSGVMAERLHNAVLQCGEGLSGEVVMTGRQSGLNEAARKDLALILGDAEMRKSALENAISVPIRGEAQEICGAITLYKTKEAPFSEDDLRLLGTVATQASVAIANAGAFEKTEKTALTDPLTGLPNARCFFLQLEQEMSRSVRENRPFSLLLLDIDHFKDINDDFGHQQGDRILRELAGVFREEIRDYDVVARYGGDEFFMLLPGTPNKEALETIARVKEAVSQYQPGLGNDPGFRIQVSVGLATFPGDATDAKALLALADKAMYADKKLNRYHSQLLLSAKISTERDKKAGKKTAKAAPAPATSGARKDKRE